MMNYTKEIEDYICRHIDKEEEVLQWIDRETNLNVLGARMISGHLQGKALSMFAKMIKPSNILEIGTFTGYSAICLAQGLPKDGKLVTIEIDDELEKIACNAFLKAGLNHKIELIIGNALDIIPQLPVKFDLVFIDGDKREYLKYYQLALEKTNPGAYIIADNTLWNGKVTQIVDTKDEQTQGIINFNAFVGEDIRVEKVILPVRDGMTIMRKIS